jgi:glycosyltransferase involved in cell wall biosynthesis
MQGSNVSISVLIPARGNAQYLDKTLVSLRGSSVLPLEILIIDDGLNQNVLQRISEDFLDLPIQIINSDGRGIVSALNTGLSASRGEFIARLDADDIVYPNRLYAQLQFLKLNTSCLAVGSQVVYLDENDRELGFSKYPVGLISDLDLFYKKCLVAHPSVMFRRSSAIDIGGYRSLMKYNENDLAEDFDFWIRMSRSGDVANLSDPLTGYRLHANQVTARLGGPTAIATLYAEAVGKFEHKINDKIDFTIVVSYSELNDSPYVKNLIKSQLGILKYSHFRLESALLFINKELGFNLFLLKFLVKLIRKISDLD